MSYLQRQKHVLRRRQVYRTGTPATITGTLAITQTPPTLAFAGALTFTGTFSVAVPAPAVAFTGSVAAPVVSSNTPRGWYTARGPGEAPKPTEPEPIPEISGTFAIRIPAPFLRFVGTAKPKVRKYKPRPIHGRLRIRAPAPSRPRFVGSVDNSIPIRWRVEDEEILTFLLSIDEAHV